MKKAIFSSLFAMLLATVCTFSAKAQQEDPIYNFVKLEHPPTYPGGIAMFYKFLMDNIKYPKDALAHKVQGNVHLAFVVEKDGSLSDIKVVRSLGYGTDEEALRILKMSNKWNPGLINGQPVRVKYNIPIRFALNR